MATEPNPTDRTPPRRKMRARRVARALAITMVIVLLAAAAGVAFVASEAGLAMAARILISRSEGRLHLDSPSGSLLSAIESSISNGAVPAQRSRRTTSPSTGRRLRSCRAASSSKRSARDG